MTPSTLHNAQAVMEVPSGLSHQLGEFGKFPPEILQLIFSKLSARDLVSVESSCYSFKCPLGCLPNRSASAIEILAFQQCKVHSGVWSHLSSDQWNSLMKRCEGQWKQVLRFIQAVEMCRRMKVAAGCYESIAVTSDGSVIKFGDSYPVSSEPKIQIESPQIFLKSTFGNVKATSVTVGRSQAIILDNSGKVYSFGKDDCGSLGLGDDFLSFSTSEPQRVRFPAEVHCTQVSAGGKHTLALTSEGQVFSWGYGGNGRLGNGQAENQSEPVKVMGLQEHGFAVQVAAGGNHSIVLMENGTVLSFGCGDEYQLGHEDFIRGRPRTGGDVMEPQQIAYFRESGKHIVSITGGDGNSSAIDSDGHVYTWGDNYCGSLGHCGVETVGLPMRVESLVGHRAVQVSMRKRKTLVLMDSGCIYASGWSATGALGIDLLTSITSRMRLVEVSDKKFSQISAGWYHGLAVTTGGYLYGFGENERGQLGSDRSVQKPCEMSLLSKEISAH